MKFVRLLMSHLAGCMALLGLLMGTQLAKYGDLNFPFNIGFYCVAFLLIGSAFVAAILVHNKFQEMEVELDHLQQWSSKIEGELLSAAFLIDCEGNFSSVGKNRVKFDSRRVDEEILSAEEVVADGGRKIALYFHDDEMPTLDVWQCVSELEVQDPSKKHYPVWVEKRSSPSGAPLYYEIQFEEGFLEKEGPTEEMSMERLREVLSSLYGEENVHVEEYHGTLNEYLTDVDEDTLDDIDIAKFLADDEDKEE